MKIKKGNTFLEYYLPDDDFRYGKKNDYSIPINMLLGFKFFIRKYVWP